MCRPWVGEACGWLLLAGVNVWSLASCWVPGLGALYMVIQWSGFGQRQRCKEEKMKAERKGKRDRRREVGREQGVLSGGAALVHALDSRWGVQRPQVQEAVGRTSTRKGTAEGTGGEEERRP